MIMASMVAGSSSTWRMRRKSSRQLSPASTRIRVLPPVTTVQLPFDPEANTVKRTIISRIPRRAVQDEAGGLPGRNLVEGGELAKECAEIGALAVCWLQVPQSPVWEVCSMY